MHPQQVRVLFREMLRSEDFGRYDLDPKAVEADIMAFARGQKPDGSDAEILEDLRAQADLAPLALALDGLFVILTLTAPLLMRHPNGTCAQIDQHAPSLHALQHML